MGEGDQAAADAEVSRFVGRGIGAIKETGLDEAAIEDFREAFGDGGEYDWALELQEQETDERQVDADGFTKNIELKDVFEPSQLAEKMLTDEDNRIRATDIPERFQVARAPYKDLELSEEQAQEEALWVSDLMRGRRRLPEDLMEPFVKAVGRVLEFMNENYYEVPFIFQHRKDYLIHASRIPLSPDPDDPERPEFTVSAEKLLLQSDLWEIFDLDLKFRALIQKRNALQRTFDSLKAAGDLRDPIFTEMLPQASTQEELQDVQDYLYFQHPSRLADAAVANGTDGIKHQKRPGATRAMFEKIRNSKVYSLVRAFGIAPDDFAQNALGGEGRRQYTEDPGETPERMAAGEHVLDPPSFTTGKQCLDAARAFFAEEIATSPKMRKVLRRQYYTTGVIDVVRTEKGLRRIDEQHPYYEFKYLRNQQLADIAQAPGLFLRMLKAEEEGLVEVKVRLQNAEQFQKRLYADIESDNFSEVAEAWNRERRGVVDLALAKLYKIMAKNLKENLKAQCESEVALACREKFSARLDQAPYKPKGMSLGTVPRVLALSNGAGSLGKDEVHWAFVEDDGRVSENGKGRELQLGDPERDTPDGADLEALVDVVKRRRPDVIGVSGFAAETRKLFSLLKDIVTRKDLRGSEYEDDDGHEATDLLEVVMVNDEVARLYQTSDRAHKEYPSFAPLTRYCVALARYLQNPLSEYASLGRDLISLSFDPCQSYVPQDRMMKSLETAMIDYVNLVGVDINVAVGDLATANLLPYVCGLGPRKAQHLLKVINRNGGSVMTRSELVGDYERHKAQAVGPSVWNNCASFLVIDFDLTEPESDYLDGTRVHPEDYELGRKMAADALELDEEDIQAEVQEHGAGAIVRKLVKDEAGEKVNDLILEEYAEQLERNFNQRKRATLESIRAELQLPYEELRRNFESELSTTDIFTMLTGETAESLREGMVVPLLIRRVTDDAIEGRLDCGVEGTVGALEIAERLDRSPRQLFAAHTTVQACLLVLNRKRLHAELSLLEEKVRRPVRRWDPAERLAADAWDERGERADRARLEREATAAGVTGPGGGPGGGARTARVVKHPNFHPFSAAQAEEFLGSQARGDVVVRPSSKGLDHLAVTWKVAARVCQHLDVLELDKESEFAVGRTLRVAGRWSYSDLDELIVNHVKAMARKVDEMMLHEKFQNGTKADTGTSLSPIASNANSNAALPQTSSYRFRSYVLTGRSERWLTTYTEANPRRSVYAFCLDPKHPGYFHLCFKAGQKAALQSWPVKVLPGAFELQKVQYLDMKALCNGFKILFNNMSNMKGR